MANDTNALPLGGDEFDPFYDPKYDPNSDQYEPPAPIDEPKKKRGGTQKALDPRTRDFFEKRGYQYAQCAKWEADRMFNAETKRREIVRLRSVDLFGFMDAIAFRRDLSGVVAIQTTSRANMSNRIRSAITNEKANDKKNPNRGVALVHWLLAGNRFFVVGWEKPRRLWEVRIFEVTLDTVERVQRGERLKVQDAIVTEIPSRGSK
ncbi:hypothetical protein [Caudoviricetes sp.]|nr:hypothetical protein [Caudoviricetes sp.]